MPDRHQQECAHRRLGAIAIVDAGDYPTAAADLHAFSAYFGIPDANLTVRWPGTTKPPVYSDWLVEEALDIEWAHAMAPNAKIFLVESKQVNTDPTWAAVKLAANLVANAGGGCRQYELGRPGSCPGDKLGRILHEARSRLLRRQR